jgi:hypothetical protein
MPLAANAVSCAALKLLAEEGGDDNAPLFACSDCVGGIEDVNGSRNERFVT